MPRHIIAAALAAALAFAVRALPAHSEETTMTETAAASPLAEYDRPVRPGGVNGQEFWNGRARFFMYAPAFDFRPIDGAARYRFEVVDDLHERHSFEADAPTAALSPVWGSLPTGYVTVTCQALDGDGKALGACGERTFWKSAPFMAGSYPPAARGYAESARMVYRYLLDFPSNRHLRETGEPGTAYAKNYFISEMYAGLIRAMVHYAQIDGADREQAMATARRAADFLLSISEPADAPLAHFPPTYLNAPAQFEGQTMLIYPAVAAKSYLLLGEATGEEKYIQAAVNIAETYLKLQGEDGTWPLRLMAKDGSPAGDNRLLPIDCVIPLMERLHARTGDPRYRHCADRAFAYVENGPLKTWNWEAQFEDTELTAKFQNMGHQDADDTALYLLRRFPGDPRRLAQAEEILRFAEDQFVCWEAPWKGRRLPSDLREGFWSKDTDNWHTPAVVEQFDCRWPIDSCAGKLLVPCLALHRATGDGRWLQKARALADSMTQMVQPDGRLPTWWIQPDHAGNDWHYNMIQSAEALEELDEFLKTTDDKEN